MKAIINHIISFLKNNAFLTFIVCAAIILFIAAADADFTTKGEPREALVSRLMLNTGNYVLPIDGAGDMSYKPPLFHWLAAICSMPAGHVSEFTARMPSVLALLFLLCMTYWFVKSSDTKPSSRYRPLLSCIVLFTSFEVIRAGANCRVDMLLSALIASAMMLLWRGGFSLRGYKWLKYWLLAALCMSGAVLTKGPVGMILPVGLWWIAAILWNKGEKDAAAWWKVTLLAMLLACVSLILPALWYMAAYQQGGEKFLSLVMEENFGRMLGKMTYASHVKPFWYNFVILASGTVPWCILLVLSLLYAPWSRMHRPRLDTPRSSMPKVWFRNISSQEFFCWVMMIGVFVFYTIPKSKRGVYLLPLYPFAACLITDYIIYSASFLPKIVKRALACGVTFIALYAVIYCIVWPHLTHVKSDKKDVAEMQEYIGNLPVYSYINSRMDRFYGLEFYLDKPVISLLPSGQVMPMPPGGYTPEMVNMPRADEYILLMTDKDEAEQFPRLVHYFNEKGYLVNEQWASSKKSCDMGQGTHLFRVSKHSPLLY